MTSSYPTIESYIESFPNTLLNIQGAPTFETLNNARIALKANAANVPTVLGGGANGYVGLVVTPQVYAIIAPGTPFIRPPCLARSTTSHPSRCYGRRP